MRRLAAVRHGWGRRKGREGFFFRGWDEGGVRYVWTVGLGFGVVCEPVGRGRCVRECVWSFDLFRGGGEKKKEEENRVKW